MSGISEPIVVEQFISRSVGDVWNALTKWDIMIKWYFENIPAFESKVGFETQFPVQSETRTFTHVWKVTGVDEFKSIDCNWSYTEYEGDCNVRFEVEPQHNGTLVRVISTVLSEFPSDIPEFEPESCRGGWTYFLNERLKPFMEQ